MLNNEQVLLVRVARLVMRMAERVEDIDTRIIDGVQEAINSLTDQSTADEFAPATARLSVAFGADKVSLAHTGGGIYVLYFMPEGEGQYPAVGITPSPEGDGWFVLGYKTYDDDSAQFLKDNVPTEDLHAVVARIYADVIAANNQPVDYIIPGQFRWNGERFLFIPSAGYAGYFGPEFIEVETGNKLRGPDAAEIWVAIANRIQSEGGTPSIEWEG
jgi:hypothetical protein